MLALAVTWGSLPSWLILAGVISLAFLLRGSQAGPALGYMREANAALEREITELKRLNAKLTAENAALHASRDLEPTQLAIVGAIEHHEKASARRDQGMLHVLDMIAAKLGPDNAH